MNELLASPAMKCPLCSREWSSEPTGHRAPISSVSCSHSICLSCLREDALSRPSYSSWRQQQQQQQQQQHVIEVVNQDQSLYLPSSNQQQQQQQQQQQWKVPGSCPCCDAPCAFFDPEASFSASAVYVEEECGDDTTLEEEGDRMVDGDHYNAGAAHQEHGEEGAHHDDPYNDEEEDGGPGGGTCGASYGSGGGGGGWVNEALCDLVAAVKRAAVVEKDRSRLEHASRHGENNGIVNGEEGMYQCGVVKEEGESEEGDARGGASPTSLDSAVIDEQSLGRSANTADIEDGHWDMSVDDLGDSAQSNNSHSLRRTSRGTTSPPTPQSPPVDAQLEIAFRLIGCSSPQERDRFHQRSIRTVGDLVQLNRNDMEMLFPDRKDVLKRDKLEHIKKYVAAGGELTRSSTVTRITISNYASSLSSKSVDGDDSTKLAERATSTTLDTNAANAANTNANDAGHDTKRKNDVSDTNMESVGQPDTGSSDQADSGTSDRPEAGPAHQAHDEDDDKEGNPSSEEAGETEQGHSSFSTASGNKTGEGEGEGDWRHSPASVVEHPVAVVKTTKAETATNSHTSSMTTPETADASNLESLPPPPKRPPLPPNRLARSPAASSLATSNSSEISKVLEDDTHTAATTATSASDTASSKKELHGPENGTRRINPPAPHSERTRPPIMTPRAESAIGVVVEQLRQNRRSNGDDLDSARKGVTTLANLAHGQTANRISIVSSNGISAIVSTMLLYMDSVPIQSQGCRALWKSLCVDHPSLSGEVVADSGAVDAIVTAMDEHRTSESVQRPACAALRYLAVNWGTSARSAIVRSGGVLSIVAAMNMHRRTSSDVCVHGCGAIQNLAADPNVRTSVASGRGVEAVVGAMEAQSERGDVQVRGCGALRNLALKNEIIDSIVEAGGIRAISNAMRCHPKSAFVQEHGAFALKLLNKEENSEAGDTSSRTLEKNKSRRRHHSRSGSRFRVSSVRLRRNNSFTSDVSSSLGSDGSKSLRALRRPSIKKRWLRPKSSTTTTTTTTTT